MDSVLQVILSAGRTAVDLAFYTLLPIMVVMLALMKWLDAWGILAWLARHLGPLTRPFGIPGLGIFAALQLLLVGFAAPVASLALMNQQQYSHRSIAATLAMVLVMTQANVLFPLAAFGLDLGFTLATSVFAGLIAAATTYYGFSRHWDQETEPHPLPEPAPKSITKNPIRILAEGGLEGLHIVLNALPMLILAIAFVNTLHTTGAVKYLSLLLAPIMQLLQLPDAAVLPLVTKFVAGGTAFMGVTMDLIQQGSLDAQDLNRMAGFATNPLDIVGVAILASAGTRVAQTVRPAILGALVGLVIRGSIHLSWF